jgi:hypothetical protein
MVQSRWIGCLRWQKERWSEEWSHGGLSRGRKLFYMMDVVLQGVFGIPIDGSIESMLLCSVADGKVINRFHDVRKLMGPWNCCVEAIASTLVRWPLNQR